MTRSVLDRTLPATQLLQTKNADIIDGMNVICSLKELAIAMLVDAKDYHVEWYSRALQLSEKVNVQESKRRTCVRQVHRPNPQYTTISDYWFKVLTSEVLAHLSVQLEERFDCSSMISYQGLAVIPSKLISSFYSLNNLKWRESFLCFVNFYRDDFPKIGVIEGEMDAWERFCLETNDNIPNTVLTTLQKISNISHSFPNVYQALKILIALPITSCECERSFSGMKKLKNCFRMTMTKEG